MALQRGRRAELLPSTEGAVLRIKADGKTELELQVVISEAGPRLRVRAPSLEFVADEEIVARCRDFRVEAEGEVALRAGGSLRAEGWNVRVEAQRGDLLLKANDDVRVLGEEVLLNCERDPPMPAWLPLAVASAPVPLLPRQDVTGDPSLLTAIHNKE